MTDPARPAATRRVNDGLLGRVERWALPRMAAALPAWVTPDRLTATALAGALVAAVAYALAGDDPAWLWMASLGLVVHWWGDSLDGTVARVRQIRRERYGFFVDHQCDAVSVVLLALGAGTGSLMRMDVALGAGLGVLMLMLLVNMVAAARGVFKISFSGFGPTELRLAAVGLNTVVWAVGPRTYTVAGHAWTLFDLIGLAVAVVLGGFYAVSAVRETRRIARLDPTPRPGRDGLPFDPTGQALGPADGAESAAPVPAPGGSR